MDVKVSEEEMTEIQNVAKVLISVTHATYAVQCDDASVIKQNEVLKQHRRKLSKIQKEDKSDVSKNIAPYGLIQIG
jgi:hypothetical protein